jgi:hypothetical protein
MPEEKDVVGMPETGMEQGEPWEPWETKLVGWSIAIGIVVLVIGGWLINVTILAH